MLLSIALDDVPVVSILMFRGINDSEEIYEIGFEDYIGEDGSVVIIEWADKILDEMPEGCRVC